MDSADDLEIFEEHITKYFKEASLEPEIEPPFLFARLIPGTSELVSLNSRVLCNRCYMDFARETGRSPDRIYIYLTFFAGNNFFIFPEIKIIR